MSHVLKNKRRAIVLVLDSFGVGASHDALHYGDAAANTFGHIVEACAEGQADVKGVRQGALHIPCLADLGLFHVALSTAGKKLPGFDEALVPKAAYGYAVEQSPGKDTPSGHWEMMGVPLFEDWGYFPLESPCFPAKLIEQLVQESNLPGILGNKHASGTTIIEELGAEHLKTGKPIVYTSADSVFQIAAHEHYFGLEKLYVLCEHARELVTPYRIARVIARPFIGEVGTFKRTSHRRDYALPPPHSTLLDRLIASKGQVIAIGKIADIFAHQGISVNIHAENNQDTFNKTLKALKEAEDKTLIFSNFVDFDTLYGHRRDVIGYAKSLEEFDARLPELINALQPEDIVIITADHGCDPTQPGSDHTREYVPILAFGPNVKPYYVGRRESFADVGQTLAAYFDLAPLDFGIAW